MSGPKTSRYTLTPEQRRILEEQRKIRVQRELLEKRRGEIRSVVVRADRIIEQTEPLREAMAGDMGTLDRVKHLRAETMETVNRAARLDDSSGLSLWKETNEKLQRLSAELATLTRTLEQEYAGADRAFRQEMGERIAGGFALSFGNLGSVDTSQTGTYGRKIQEALASLASVVLSGEQQARLEQIRAKAAEIDSGEFMKNYYAMTVLPFVKECRAYHEAYAACGAEYEQKLMIYRVNAQTLGIEAEDIPFSADAISLLDAKIQETEAAIAFREEQAYISRCVDEALREMGYSVLGSREVVTRTGKHYRNELYLFDEGTAVNVTYSGDGQITMELGGIDTEDRTPSRSESAGLASDMRSFCDDYGELERRLRLRGIVTKRICVLPPEEQYAQIINVSDYDLCGPVSAYEEKAHRKQTADVQKRKIGE